MLRLFNWSIFAASAAYTIHSLKPKFKPIFRFVDVKERHELVTEVVRSKEQTKGPAFYDTYTRFVTEYVPLVPNTLLELLDQTPVGQAFTFKLFRFNNEFELKTAGQTFQNILLAMVDSQMGYTACLIYGQKPVVTAHIGYNLLKELKAGEKYLSHAYLEKLEGNNVWVNVVVIDSEGETVARFESRFVKLNLALV